MMMREDRRVPFPSTLRLLLFSNIYIYLMLSFIMIIWGIHTKLRISKGRSRDREQQERLTVSHTEHRQSSNIRQKHKNRKALFNFIHTLQSAMVA